MLVLTRRQNDSIHIDGGITITVVRISGDRIRIGIQAPEGTRILRGELAEKEVAHDPS